MVSLWKLPVFGIPGVHSCHYFDDPPYSYLGYFDAVLDWCFMDRVLDRSIKQSQETGKLVVVYAPYLVSRVAILGFFIFPD
ncbi:protein of unknown function [Xenorhabdus poinarii G6]|uniref:Uncharacterized protein n=1 Tax=Xenorhabdus poinarii G6 TaxID=1354304 RepID=A0A068R2E1_9GAMM|nr:protein of unknown function [Xenorhabdus poinarii G6]